MDRSGGARSERGSVILMAMFLAFFISALFICIELLRLSDLEDITNQIEDMQAYYCAEAGIEYAIWKSRYSQYRSICPPAAGAFWPATNAEVTVTENWTGEGGVAGCTDNGAFTSQGSFTIVVQTKKADPNYGYYHYFYVTSTGRNKKASDPGAFTRRVRAQIRRPRTPECGNPAGTYATYQQIRRWHEL